MGNVKRRMRQRLDAPESLTAIWNRGDPPPDWAFADGEHHDEIIGLVFGMDGDDAADSRTHPHRHEWFDAMRASRP